MGKKTFKSPYYILSNFILFFVLFLLLFILSESLDNPFKKLKKLPNGNYYIIRQNGIYLYNNNFTNYKTLYTFQDSEKIITYDDRINTIISELKQDDKTHIINFIKKKIYIYNYEDDNMYDSPYNLKELSDKNDYHQNGVNYNLIPYEFSNDNLKFIIAFIVEGIVNHVITFVFYTINIFKKSITCNKELEFYDKSVFGVIGYFSDISPYNISCQISSYPFMMSCFYRRSYSKIFRLLKFNIQNKPETNDAIEIKRNDKEMISVKSSISTNKKKIFGCFLLSDYSTKCYFNIISNNNIKEISYSTLFNCKDMKTYYFNEMDEFVLICKNENNFQIQKLNFKENINNNNYINYCYLYNLEIKSCKILDMYSLTYNNSINSYNIITDYNFTRDSNECIINETNYNLIYKDPDYDFNKIISDITFDDQYEYIDTTTTTTKINATKTTNININTNTSLPISIAINTTEKIYDFNLELNKEKAKYDYAIFKNDTKTNNLTIAFNINDLEKILYSFNNGLDISNISFSNDFKEMIKENGEEIIAKFENIDVEPKQVIENLETLMNTTAKNKTCKLIFDDFSVTISDTNTQSPKNETHVDFGPCEQILKKYYNISDSAPLRYELVDIKNDDPNSLHNQVEYALYSDKNEKLDMSLCKDTSITVYYKIKNNTSLDTSSLKTYSEKGIDILDTKDSFYNDICHPFSENGNDIIISDRRQDIYKNYSLCDKGCDYNNIDLDNLVIACDCKVKENISDALAPLQYDEFEDVSLMNSNIGIAICYKLVFSFKGKLTNIGFWIFSIFFMVNVILIVFYLYNGIKPILEYLFEEMVNYGYLNRKHRFFFEEKDEKEKKIKDSMKKISNPIIKSTKNKKKKKIATKNKIREKSHKATNSRSYRKSKSKDNTSLILNQGDKANISEKHKKNYKTHKKIVNLSTGGPKPKNKEKKDSENYAIIKIDLNNISNYYPKDSNQTLHNYTFNEAIDRDRRSIFMIYYIYLLSKQIIFHTFLQKSPLKIFTLRLCLLIFMLSTDLALNALLYMNDNISKKYKYAKSFFLLSFSDNITIIIYSTLLTVVMLFLVTKLSNYENSIRNVFRKEEELIHNNKNYRINKNRKNQIFLEIEKILKRLKIKLMFLIIVQIVLMLFFWYFVTAFCQVYKSTQISWIWDSFLSVLSRTIIELLFALLFSKLYIVSIESNFYSLYRAFLFIYDFS